MQLSLGALHQLSELGCLVMGKSKGFVLSRMQASADFSIRGQTVNILDLAGKSAFAITSQTTLATQKQP